MGKQVNFYLTKNDVTELLVFLDALEPFYILERISKDSTPVIVKDLGSLFIDKPVHFLVKKSDLKDIVMNSIPSRSEWSVDARCSPVIEMLQGPIIDGQLRNGRFFYVDKFFGSSDELVVKTPEFIQWAKVIFAKTKKHLTKHGPDYIGKEVSNFLEAETIRLI